MLESILAVLFIIVSSILIIGLSIYVYKTKSKETFKYIFFTLVSLSLLAFTFIFILCCYYEKHLVLVFLDILPFIALIGFKVLIFKLIFKDAKINNLNPWFSVNIALFVPNILGIIIYLMMRNKSKIYIE